MKNIFLVVFITLPLGACCFNPLPAKYLNYNATQDDFMKARYECYKETAQRVSDVYVNPYGGVAGSEVMPSCSAFNACMASRGFIEADTNGNFAVPQGMEIKCRP